MRKILKKCHAGDWFVLNQVLLLITAHYSFYLFIYLFKERAYNLITFILVQICKNVDPYFFHEFIWQLSVDIGKNRGGPRRMQARIAA